MKAKDVWATLDVVVDQDAFVTRAYVSQTLTLEYLGTHHSSLEMVWQIWLLLPSNHREKYCRRTGHRCMHIGSQVVVMRAVSLLHIYSCLLDFLDKNFDSVTGQLPVMHPTGCLELLIMSLGPVVCFILSRPSLQSLLR